MLAAGIGVILSVILKALLVIAVVLGGAYALTTYVSLPGFVDALILGRSGRVLRALRRRRLHGHRRLGGSRFGRDRPTAALPLAVHAEESWRANVRWDSRCFYFNN